MRPLGHRVLGDPPEVTHEGGIQNQVIRAAGVLGSHLDNSDVAGPGVTLTLIVFEAARSGLAPCPGCSFEDLRDLG